MTPEAKSLVVPVVVLSIGIIIAGLIVVWAMEQDGLLAPKERTLPGMAADFVEHVKDAAEGPSDAE